MRVFIADDHRLFAQALRAALTAEQIDVVGIAGDGGEAVDRTLELEPDVLLLDLDMPRVDGFEAMRRLRQHAAQVRIIILTGADSGAGRREAADLGAIGFVSKAEDLGALVTTVRTIAALALHA